MTDARRELAIITTLKDRFSRPLQRLLRGIRAFARAAIVPFKALASSIFSIRGALVAVTGAIGARALFGQAQAVAENAKQFGLWAEKLGVTVEELDEVGTAASRVLGPQGRELIVEGLKTLQERMDDAARGTATYREQFDRLGVSVVDSQGRLRNVLDVFNELSVGFRKLSTEERVLIGEDLFGGTENFLTILLSRGPEALRKLREEARALGPLFDSQLVAQADRFGAAIQRVQRLFGQLSNTVFQQLEPVVTGFLRTIETNIQGIIEDAPSWISSVFDFARRIASGFLQVVTGALTIVRQVLGGVEAGVNAIGAGFVAIERRVISFARNIRSVAAELISVFDEAKAARILISDALDAAFEEPRDFSPIDLTSFARDAEQGAKTFAAQFNAAATLIGQVLKGQLSGAVVEAGQESGGFLGRLQRNLRSLPELVFGNKDPKQAGNDSRSTFGIFIDGLANFGARLRNFDQFANDASERIGESLVSNLADAFVRVTTNIKDAQRAFKDFAQAILRDIQALIARRLSMQIVGAALDGFGLGGGGDDGGGWFTDTPSGATIGNGPGAAPARFGAARLGGAGAIYVSNSFQLIDAAGLDQAADRMTRRMASNLTALQSSDRGWRRTLRPSARV